jgi:hypothetical protein
VPISKKTEKTRDVQIIKRFLHTLAKLCFEDCDMPLIGVGTRPEARKSYFTFKDWHMKMLRHVLLCKDRTLDPKVVRASIIPLLMTLNLALQRTSYFPEDLPMAYDISWTKIYDIMTNAPDNLEEMCRQLLDPETPEAMQPSQVTLFCELRNAGLSEGQISILCRMDRITRSAKNILSQRSKRPRQLSVTWVGLIDKDCCCSDKPVLEESLREAFSDANVTQLNT